MHRIRWLWFILIIIVTTNIFAAQPSELEKIAAKIISLKKYLTEKRAKKDSLTTELSAAEKKISYANLRIRNIDEKIKQQQRALSPLQSKQKQYQAKLNTQQQQLAKQLRTAYQMGQHSYLQLFLSQQQPSDIDRLSVYYRAINQARSELIQQFTQNLKRVKNNQLAINNKLNALQQLKNKRVVAEQQLIQQQRQRKQLLGRISAQIKTSQQRVTQLQADKQHLQKVVDNLNVEKTYQKFTGVSFANLRHRLPWPVDGHVTRKYGQLYDGRLISNGVFIIAPLDSPVRAVAAGKVIFANWLRGYGNMIIISHGGGYMTLYAHNNSLFKQVGDAVKPGEEIAIVGNSGGLTDPGLYFEIRYRGKTRDPALWCTRNP